MVVLGNAQLDLNMPHIMRGIECTDSTGLTKSTGQTSGNETQQFFCQHVLAHCMATLEYKVLSTSSKEYGPWYTHKKYGNFLKQYS